MSELKRAVHTSWLRQKISNNAIFNQTALNLQKLCIATVFFCILLQSNDCMSSINP